MRFNKNITTILSTEQNTNILHYIKSNLFFKMARVLAVLIFVVAVVAVNSQYLGYPYATTATSFALPYFGGFPYAPAIAPVGPVLKAAAPYGAYPYGAAYGHPIAPVVKTAFPYGYGAPFLKAAGFPFGAAIVKTAVPPALPAVAPVLKAALPFPAPVGPIGPVGPPALPGPVPAPIL